ncbi:QacH, quaternary ammonium compound-resistance protein [Oceanicola granulosus HTCC2516]|uniref:QacH, quaternary ammonium compound-resistance protein n=1 Tax=Oceanicola granulosus (strain ATCC BAA-861 / DSM 15982 / KCTC 12143 / HTCC2516) TaxID=314256 RepID=Q2CCZ1_OCEGH|nr:multidrug efflux SMR transporter [Oceanicola granulosus]EAR50585.1 QacH, quaternary ammonium compound-resistance protein [Oceanicola granulosus HTCC2516]
MPTYLILAAAVLFETIGTTALKASAAFTRPGPTLIVIAGYGLAFYFLALTLRTLPVGVAYALWSALGIALITLIGWVWYGERLDGAALAGLGLIAAGVIVIQLFSGTATH